MSAALRRLAIALIVAAPIETLGAFWWWAMFGMAPQIGMAHAVTVIVLLIAGSGALLTSFDLAHSGRNPS